MSIVGTEGYRPFGRINILSSIISLLFNSGTLKISSIEHLHFIYKIIVYSLFIIFLYHIIVTSPFALCYLALKICDLSFSLCGTHDFAYLYDLAFPFVTLNFTFMTSPFKFMTLPLPL